MKPLARIHTALGFIVPVLAQLHRDSGGISIPVTQDRGHPCDRRANALPDSTPRFLEHQPRGLFLIRRIGKHQPHPLDGVVARSHLPLRHDGVDPVEIHPMPAQRRIMPDRTLGPSRDLVCPHPHRAALRLRKTHGIERQCDRLPSFTVRWLLRDLFQHALGRRQGDLHRLHRPVLARLRHRCRPRTVEGPFAHRLELRSPHLRRIVVLSQFSQRQCAVIEPHLIHHPAKVITIARSVLPTTDRQSVPTRHPLFPDPHLTRPRTIEVDPHDVAIVAHRQVIPGIDPHRSLRRNTQRDGIVLAATDVHPRLQSVPRQHQAKVPLHDLIAILAHQPRRHSLRRLVVRRNKGPQLQRELLGIQLRRMRDLQVVRPVQPETAAHPPKRSFPRRDRLHPGTRRQDQSQAVRPSRRFKAGFHVQRLSVFRDQRQPGHVCPLKKSPRFNQARPAIPRPCFRSRAAVVPAIHLQAQTKRRRWQPLPGPAPVQHRRRIPTSVDHRSKMRNLQRLRVLHEGIRSRLHQPMPGSLRQVPRKPLRPTHQRVILDTRHQLHSGQIRRTRPRDG